MGKKFVTQVKLREFYLDWNVATLEHGEEFVKQNQHNFSVCTVVDSFSKQAVIGLVNKSRYS